MKSSGFNDRHLLAILIPVRLLTEVRRQIGIHAFFTTTPFATEALAITNGSALRPPLRIFFNSMLELEDPKPVQDSSRQAKGPVRVEFVLVSPEHDVHSQIRVAVVIDEFPDHAVRPGQSR